MRLSTRLRPNRSRAISCTALCLLVALLLAWSASARVVSMHYEADVTSVSDTHGLLGGSVMFGSTLEGFASWDPDSALDSSIPPVQAQYLSPAPTHEAFALVGGHRFWVDTQVQVTVHDGWSGLWDRFGVGNLGIGDASSSLGGGVQVDFFSFFIVDLTQTAFDSLDLPLGLPDPSLFAGRHVSIRGCITSEVVGGTCSVFSLDIHADVTLLEQDIDHEGTSVQSNRPQPASTTPIAIDLNVAGANHDSSAAVILTRQYGPAGTSAIPHAHALATSWDATNGHWRVVNGDGSDMPATVATNVLAPKPGPRSFIHTTDASNVTNNWSCIDSPLLDGRPEARVILTPNASPSGVAGVVEDRAIGVWYGGAQWCVFNQDLTAMTLGLSFNVFIPPLAGDVSVLHTTDSLNTFAHYSFLDHPDLNGRPDALVFITQSWDPLAVYNDNFVSVQYDVANEKWIIFNETGPAMPIGASFNVYSPDRERFSQEHRSAVGNTVANVTFLEEPMTSHLRGALSFITQTWSPMDGGASAANARPVGIWKAAPFEEWSIFNQDISTYPLDVVHSVYRPEVDLRSFYHEALLDNTFSSDMTRIEHPLLNADPDAVFVVTPNWSAPDGLSVYDDHDLGVYYGTADARWWIRNHDGAAMPLGAGFNVLLPGEDDIAFQHVASAANTTGSETTIDHPLLNGTPYHRLLVQSNGTGFGAPTVANPHPIAVDFDAVSLRWNVVHQDGAAIPSGATFNVIGVPEPGVGLMLLSAIPLLAGMARRRIDVGSQYSSREVRFRFRSSRAA